MEVMLVLAIIALNAIIYLQGVTTAFRNGSINGIELGMKEVYRHQRLQQMKGAKDDYDVVAPLIREHFGYELKPIDVEANTGTGSK